MRWLETAAEREEYMVLKEILRAVADLDGEERQLLRRQLKPQPGKRYELPPKDRMRQLNAALDAVGEDMSLFQLEQMTAAITEK